MLFYEPLFLFLFFPAVFAAFLLVRRRAGLRAAVLLIASLAFYLWAEPLFVPVVLLTCCVDYALGQVAATPGAKGRIAVACGIVVNLGMLLCYKYAGFATANINVLLGQFGLAKWHVPVIPLPIGVSFIVFEKITYLVDIKRGRSQPAPNLSTYLLYVFLFPKLLAGPIIKYHELEAQLRQFGQQREGDIEAGFQRFMLGVVKKILLADTLASAADAGFAADPASLGFLDAWWSVLCFSLQIYFDFSAYSDMAIGLARMFGFRLNENFNKPYISQSVTEFWRRWHISLSTWIRDYLYIPLGGNRVSTSRRYVNLWVCFLLSGLWHGAAWTFIAWGAYQGIFLIFDRLFLLRQLAAMPKFLAMLTTFIITMIGWTIFRAASMGQAFELLRHMVWPDVTHHSSQLWRTASMITAVIVASFLSFAPIVPNADRVGAAILQRSSTRILANLVLSVLFIVALCFALAAPFRPFLYFRF